MEHAIIETAHLPEKDQFAFYREEYFEGLKGMTVERKSGGGFRARVATSFHPSLVRIEARSDACLVARTPRDIGRIGWNDWLAVFHEKGKASLAVHRKEETVMKAGDLFIMDLNAPCSHRSVVSQDHAVWLFPRHLIEMHLAKSATPQFLQLATANGAGGLVRIYLEGLNRELDALSDQELYAITDNFCRLLAIACGGAAGEHADAVRAGYLSAVKQYIDLNLSHPELAPDNVAAACRISTRSLHRLFERTGESFHRYLMRRRLEECRASLVNPLNADRSVTDIALSHGFNNLATFYRNFAAAFGASPREIRHASVERDTEGR